MRSSYPAAIDMRWAISTYLLASEKRVGLVMEITCSLHVSPIFHSRFIRPRHPRPFINYRATEETSIWGYRDTSDRHLAAPMRSPTSLTIFSDLRTRILSTPHSSPRFVCRFEQNSLG